MNPLDGPLVAGLGDENRAGAVAIAIANKTLNFVTFQLLSIHGISFYPTSL